MIKIECSATPPHVNAERADSLPAVPPYDKHYDWVEALRRRGICGPVIDVGTNTGGFVDCWLELGASMVVAFEPIPSLFSMLATRYAANTRVMCVPMGLSDRASTEPSMNVHNCWTLLPAGGEPVLAPALEYASAPPFSVTFDTLDAFCERESIEPTFIKIDTDGYDGRVLRGGTRVIERYRPVMKLELSALPLAIGDCCECIVRWCFARGYAAQHVVTGEMFSTAEALLRCFPWHTSYDVLLFPD